MQTILPQHRAGAFSQAHCTKEYKLDAISLVLDQGHTTSEVSRSLEIDTNILRRWIREYQADGADQLFWGNGKLTLEREEIRSLKAQIKQLKLEREILKEAAVFFMKETK